MIPSFSEWAQTQGLKRIEEMLSSSPGGNSKILSSSWIFTNIDENVNLNEEIVNEDVAKTELITTLEDLKILQDSSTITSSKKKKKKKPRKKKLEGSTESIIKWGNVEEILFSRSYSFNSIPNNGAFPLGLGESEDRYIWSLDDYSSMQSATLITRAQTIGVPIPIAKDADHSSAFTLETRQYDYKKGANPLFCPLSEEDRIKILNSSYYECEKNEVSNTPNRFRARSRTDSILDSNDLNILNKEIKSIRSTRDQTGCSCKPIKVDKLSAGKAKSELGQYCQLIGMQPSELESLSKAEISSKLKEALKKCSLCVNNNCECVKLEINCSAEVCGCIGKRGQHSQNCGNIFGQVSFDPESVDKYRKQFVTT